PEILTEMERRMDADAATRRVVSTAECQRLLEAGAAVITAGVTPLARSVRSITDAAAVFDEYDYAVVRGNAVAVALVPRVLKLLKQHERGLLPSADIIGGNVQQLRMEHI